MNNSEIEEKILKEYELILYKFCFFFQRKFKQKIWVT